MWKRTPFPKYRRVKRSSALEPYYQMIEDWLGRENCQATRIHELVGRQGYSGSYETVKRYVRAVKQKRDRIAYLRFETLPRQQAQVDFADFQVVMANGAVKTLYVLVMVWGYSRHMYIEFVERCTMTDFLDCHQQAFRFFGGSPVRFSTTTCETWWFVGMWARLRSIGPFWSIESIGIQTVGLPALLPVV